MWEKPETKTLYTLNVDGYDPAITALTYPLMQAWARRIGAEFHVIDRRQFPGWPVVYEKLQIYDLAQQHGNDWSIFLDSDALVHPDTPDFTVLLSKDTVVHHGADMAAIRWTYDHYFRRDGRHIGCGNWLAIASDWCLDLWHPLEDLTLAEAVARIQPTDHERQQQVSPCHLLDDFVLSRNIARYGLKFQTILQLQERLGLTGARTPEFFFHEYTAPDHDKVALLTATLARWNL